ncbi:hypothetical protein [uncultured Parvibaculum sp.]|uniref:hypothetical protein n=1 Tax=uncultured Parvibaculum sp. TaxID=291828 RepID=UPI0030D96EBB|tara:strand:- start:161950 stop:162408 length:459 start_codon:yes stop_codon:yes gene_type:complete
MRRSGAAALLFLVLMVPAAGAAPAGIGAADYADAMAGLADTRAAMTGARADFAAGRHDGAAARAADLAARLEATRALMRRAVRADRTALPFAKLTPARQRARCLVLAAGLIDEPLRDLWTVWSMTARGAAGAADVPLAAEGVEGMGRPPGCG